MKAKIFSLFAFGVLAFLFLISTASAATLTQWNFDSSSLTPSTGTGTLTVNAGGTASYVNGNPATGKALSSDNWDANDYFNITINTSGYEDIILSFDQEISATGPTSFKIQYSSDGTTFTDLPGSTTPTVLAFTANPMHTFSFSSITAIDNNANTKLRIVVPTAAANALGAFHLDNLLISGTALPATPSEITTCTTTGNPGSLKVKQIDFANNGLLISKTLSSTLTFGEDDQWFPFEDIETEIQIKNDGNDDINNIEINWGIYNTKTNEWVIEMDNLKEFDLKDGDTKTFTVPFSIDDNMDVDLSDLSDGDHYKFYVTAMGEVDNDTAPQTCISDFEPASVVIESDFVIINNVDFPESVQCGQTVQVTGTLWNVGDNDQDSVALEVLGRESVLKLDQTIEAGDINAFDNAEFSFNFKVPSNLEEKNYAIEFNVKDEDSDTYQNDFNDDYSEFTIPFTVKGGCSSSVESQVQVVADIASGGKAGQPLVIKATLINNGQASKTYSLNVAGSGSWASSYSLDQSVVTLAAGESKNVGITFNVNKDAEGSQGFTLEMTADGQTSSQPVTVNVQEAPGFLSGITGKSLGGNGLIWVIGILNLILIIVIILVAVRIARK